MHLPPVPMRLNQPLLNRTQPTVLIQSFHNQNTKRGVLRASKTPFLILSLDTSQMREKLGDFERGVAQKPAIIWKKTPHRQIAV